MGGLPPEASGIVVSKGDSSSDVSAMVKSDIVAILMDGDRVTGDAGTTASVAGMAIGSSGGEWGIRGPRSLLGSPRDMPTGVAAGSFWHVPVDFGLVVVKTGGGGRPSQLRSRKATTS
jgi:hypothetical protein